MRHEADPGVVHHDVEPSPRVQRRRHYTAGAFFIGNAVLIGNRLATRGEDLLDDLLRIRPHGSSPVGAHTKVIDHHFGSALGEQSRVGPAQTRVLAAGPGDDGNPAIEPKFAHDSPFRDFLRQVGRQES